MGYELVTRRNSGRAPPHWLSRRWLGRGLRLLIQPITHHPERALSIEGEGTHEIRYGSVHVGAAFRSELSQKPEKLMGIVR
jgi:hypothetical protein